MILLGCLIAVLTSCAEQTQKLESSRQAETVVTVSESTILPSQPASTSTLTLILIMSNANSSIGLSKIAGKPDLLYFLTMDSRTDATADTNRMDFYLYGNSYSLEDTAGAVLSKISDKVFKIDVGNFGVIYKRC